MCACKWEELGAPMWLCSGRGAKSPHRPGWRAGLEAGDRAAGMLGRQTQERQTDRQAVVRVLGAGRGGPQQHRAVSPGPQSQPGTEQPHPGLGGKGWAGCLTDWLQPVTGWGLLLDQV